jgi:hypothetical protein
MSSSNSSPEVLKLFSKIYMKQSEIAPATGVAKASKKECEIFFKKTCKSGRNRN